MTRPVFLLLTFFLPLSTLRAQTPTPDPPVPSQTPLWTAELSGGEIQIALGTIQFVSSHEYVVDGGARVVEVNIATNSPLVTRFYFIGPPEVASPLGAGQAVIDQVLEKAQAITDRTGTGAAWQHVVKNYPTTTHAHTVEYRLENEDQLKRLYDSVSKAWRQGRPERFKTAK